MFINTNIPQGHTLNKSTTMLENSQALTDIAAKNAAHIRARSKRLNIALVGSHVAVVLGILGIVALGYKAPVEASSSQASFSVLEQQNTSVDQIAAANVASTVAQTLKMSVEDNVQNLAVSLNAKTELAQTDTAFLTKPQLVQQNSGRKGIISYIVKPGDTVPKVAAAFGVSEDTIRWANNLLSDALTPGRRLSIPGTTGVIHTVEPGDNIAALADKYRADPDRITTYNDLELSGLRPGMRLVIPDGVLPSSERPGYVTPVSPFGGGGGATVSSVQSTVFGGNTYAYGYCTFYAFNRRAELGHPIGSNWGNANTWDDFARAAGFTVNNIPKAGAVIQNDGGLGHVGIVERVNPDGSLLVSDMNYVGWNVISNRTVPASSVGNYRYIH